MRRALATVGFVLVLTGFATPASAQQGGLLGVQICPQDACGAAIFYGGVHFDDPSTGGDFLAFLQIAEEPEPGNVVALTGGALLLTVGSEVFPVGLVAGWAANMGDGTFRVIAFFFADADTVLVFDGTIDTNNGIPLIYGDVLIVAIAT